MQGGSCLSRFKVALVILQKRAVKGVLHTEAVSYTHLDVYKRQPWDDTPLRAVLSLPRKYREVVLLRYYEEFTLEEIADTLGIAPGTVSARLTRAKRKLRPMLEEWYYD